MNGYPNGKTERLKVYKKTADLPKEIIPHTQTPWLGTMQLTLNVKSYNENLDKSLK